MIRPAKSAFSAGPARESALAVLHKVVLRNCDLQAALDTELRQKQLKPQDSAFCTELCYGSLRHYIRLNWLLRLFLKKPENLPPLMQLRLLLGAYELTCLAGTPDYASLYLTVEGIKGAHGAKLANLGNAVLREVQRLGEASTQKEFFAAKIADTELCLSVYHSLPLWIVQLWCGSYGEEQAALFMTASREKSPVGLRVNILREGGSEFLSHLRQLPGAMPVARAGVAFATLPVELAYDLPELIQSGKLSRQSAASQEVLEAFAPENWPGAVWDACAGRGGKSMALLEAGVELSLASDVALGRLRGLQRELQRLNLSVPVARISATKPAVSEGSVRTILLDAPCSGLGTLSRHPDISLHRKPEHLQGLLNIQSAALQACAQLLLSGGQLVYLTCTLNPAENEEQLTRLLASQPGLKTEQLWQTPAISPWKEFFWGVMLRKS